MTPKEHFRHLEDIADTILPVVTCRYGYAAFVAYVFKINRSGPSEYWVGELDENQKIVAVKRICEY